MNRKELIKHFMELYEKTDQVANCDEEYMKAAMLANAKAQLNSMSCSQVRELVEGIELDAAKDNRGAFSIIAYCKELRDKYVLNPPPKGKKVNPAQFMAMAGAFINSARRYPEEL